MDNASLRRKDTTKGPPLRVLSLDGGGVRGYSMLIILQELMYRCFVEAEGRPPKREEIPKPCEYFDLIGGTGTGGLIAIMLGRLRLDLETSMEVYVRMTKRVFETDKTIAGIPYKTTLFKASKLEEAIKACVREHTVYDDEGNDGLEVVSPTSGRGTAGVMSPGDMRRSLSMRSTASLPHSPASNPNRVSVASSMGMGFSTTRWGNPDASLYDGRENRTKTAVTAVYKGTPKSGSSVLLRSYDSRKEPPPEFDCTIWQAGRATSATGLAFKPIQIGQSVFIDEGSGKYNPSPQILEEAVVNEWPGRELGMFVSIGTGKRPGGTNANQHEWWEGFIGGSMGSFAEARRRLIAKIEDCESTHIQMMNTEFPRRGVSIDNYCRLNVEVGVGEFGMNEWDRLSDMTINTRKYLKRPETQKMLGDASYRMAKIELTKRRMDRVEQAAQQNHDSNDLSIPIPVVHEQARPWPAAVELPASEIQVSPHPPPPHYRTPSNPPYPDDRTVSSHDSSMFVSVPSENKQRISAELPYRTSHENFRTSPLPSPQGAPPLPPKTPITDPMLSPSRMSPMSSSGRPNGIPRPPYPDEDGPPPPVNKLRKPEYIPR